LISFFIFHSPFSLVFDLLVILFWKKFKPRFHDIFFAIRSPPHSLLLVQVSAKSASGDFIWVEFPFLNVEQQMMCQQYRDRLFSQNLCMKRQS